MKIDRTLMRDSWRSWVASDLDPPVGPAWMQWLWTLLFCATLAAFFTVLAFTAFAPAGTSWLDPARWAFWYSRNLIVCLTIGILIHLMFAGLRRWRRLAARVTRWQPWQRTVLFTSVPLLGLALGWPLGMGLAGLDLRVWLHTPQGSRVLAVSFDLGLQRYDSVRSRAFQDELTTRARALPGVESV